MKKYLLFALLFIFSIQLTAQVPDANLLTKRWDAYWITAANSSDNEFGVYNFRKTFVLADKPGAFVVNVSADNRYKLYVNGQMVSLGPARGDIYHWNFETVDIAKHLQKGTNVIAALVWNFGDYKPEYQVSYRTGFILKGNTENEVMVNTNASWKANRDSSYSAIQPDLIYTYYVAGPGERINYAAHPLNWEINGFDDSNWKPATPIVNGLPKGVLQTDLSWMLVPRSIPQVELKTERLQKVRNATGITVPAGFPVNKTSFIVPPGSSISILLDNDFLTNAFAVLQFGKGKDAHISISYAEALYVDEGTGKNWKAQNKKGNRNEVDGKRFVGVKDELIADGSDAHTFTSLSWRTYRYLQLTIKTQGEALEIHDLYGISVNYPFELKASFYTDDEQLKKIFETGWRTAKLCAVETYTDCPYYEQLQYIGDTRIQALVSLYNTGDDRLMRNAITQLDYSRMAEGITLSRYPTANAQQIPTFSLWWIGMLNDYRMYREDSSFVKQFLPGVRQVLQFFSKYQQPDGSLKNAPYWEFTDWANGTGWNTGVAPLGKDGNSAALDLQLLWAYQVAAELEQALGMQAFANEYSKKAALLQATIKSKYWDEPRQLFADTKAKDLYSQHTNTLAILTGVIHGKRAALLARKLISDSSLTQATIYFQYYLNQALKKTGFGDLYINRLQIWKDNLDSGLTTWAETSDINTSRSDCHAWGASPNIEFFRTVLGIDTDAPGFRKIKIEPHLGLLKKTGGTMPHPRGNITVSFAAGNQGKYTATITIPKGTSGTFVWKQKEYPLTKIETRFSGL